MTILEQPQSPAFVRSPLVYHTRINTGSGPNLRVRAGLFIWQGTIGDRPASANFVLEKYPNEFDDVIWDFSQIVQSYMRHRGVSQLTQISNQAQDECWYVQAFFLWVSDTASLPIPIESNAVLAYEGYYDYISGINPVILPVRPFRVVPIPETGAAYIYPAFTNLYDLFVIRDDNNTGYLIDLRSFNEAKTEESLFLFSIGTNKLGAMGLNPTKTYSVFGVPNGGSVETELMRFELVCEPKYSPVQVFYLDRFGSWDMVTFFKRSDEQINRTDKGYFNNHLWPYEGVPSGQFYDEDLGQYRKYNSNSKSLLTLNTGIVSESSNVLFADLMNTNRILIKQNAFYYPATLAKTTWDIAQGVNDGAFAYTFQFEVAFHNVNTAAI